MTEVSDSTDTCGAEGDPTAPSKRTGTDIQLEEASTHKSAKIHVSTVFLCCDLDLDL